MTLITGLGIVNKLQSPIEFFENVLITSVTWRSGVGEGGLQFIIMYYIYKYKFVRYKNNHNRAQKSLVRNQAHSPRLHCFPNQVAKVQLFVEEWQALVFVILCYEVHCVLMWIPQLNRRCWRAKRLDSVYWDDQEDTVPVQCNTISSSVIAPRKKNATNVYTSCKYIYIWIYEVVINTSSACVHEFSSGRDSRHSPSSTHEWCRCEQWAPGRSPSSASLSYASLFCHMDQ